MRVAWFSAGVSSFIAAYLAKPDRIIYVDVANQHPDSLRFVMDCERVLQKPIEILRDVRWGGCVDNVINDRRYINGPAGAGCTTQLKKRIRKEWEWEQGVGADLVYIWGYDVDEQDRADRVVLGMPKQRHEFPLIAHGLTKADCHGMAANLGIKRPVMYDMGYPNNNCIGCVKGGMGYWNAIRRDFPEVFARRAKQERAIGHSCIKGVFLDELEEGRGRMDEVFPECSFACLGLEDDNENA